MLDGMPSHGHASFAATTLNKLCWNDLPAWCDLPAWNDLPAWCAKHGLCVLTDACGMTGMVLQVMG